MTTKTVLGTVVGTKTLDGRWAGRSKSAADAPAVLTKPMGSTAKISAVPKPAPKAPVTPAPSVTPKPKDTEPAPKPADDQAEKKAGRLLSLAKNYLGAGMKAPALKKLNEIVAKYPKTEAAKKAKDLLKDF